MRTLLFLFISLGLTAASFGQSSVAGIGGRGGGGAAEETHRPVDAANEAARFAMTDLQEGAICKQLDNGVHYILTNAAEIDNEDGWTDLVNMGSDAIIQPGYALKYSINALIAAGRNGNVSLEWQGIKRCYATETEGLYIVAQEMEASGNGIQFFLAHNAIENTNEILAQMVNFQNERGPSGIRVLDLSGGTNAAPTGQGLTDKATLISNGWIVTTN